jgi:endoglycosylceramidase
MALRALVLLLTALLLQVPAASAAPKLPLSHSGRWITDADGRVVVLHGHNMVYKRPPYAPAAAGFGDDDAAFLAGEGVNTMRVGIIYKAVEPSPGSYDDAYLDSIASTVQTLGAHGIVSLLDFHQDLYNERFQGEGFPDWAVQDDGLPNPTLGFPGNYLGNSALQRAFDHFWANDGGVQDRYAAAWAHVAARFRDDPNVLGYDLLNEPWPGTVWEPCANPVGCPEFDGKLAQFSKRTLTAIRAADPETLVFYEPNVLFNDGADTQLPDFGDTGLGMSFHDYCLTAENGGAGCAQFDDLVFSNAEAHAAETGDTLLLTEWGAIDDPGVLVPMGERAGRVMVGGQHWP